MASPWDCPITTCEFTTKDRRFRGPHLHGHGITTPPDDDSLLEGLVESGSLSQDQGLAGAIAALTKEVQEMKAAMGAQDIPTLATTVAHCEGGTCPAHSLELENHKAKIAEEVLANIPDDLVREKAAALGMYHPSQIILKPVEAT